MKKKRKNVGFTLVELLCVLVVLALLALLVGKMVTKSLNQAKGEISENALNAVSRAAEKWSINNMDKFEDIEGEPIRVGLDIVFLIDVSGSMAADLGGVPRAKATVEAFNASLKTLRDTDTENLNRIGIILFSGLSPNKDIDSGYLLNKASTSIVYSTGSLLEASKIQDLVYSTTSGKHYIKIQGQTKQVIGGTYTQLGIQAAAEMLLKSAKENRIPVIIMLTDGEPSTGIGTKEIDFSNETNLKSFKDGDTGCGHWTWCLSSETFAAPKVNGYSIGDHCQTHKAALGYANDSNYLKKVSERSTVMVWNVISAANATKKKVSAAYGGSKMYFYTIGINLTSDFGKFMLDPSDTRFKLLETSKNQLPATKPTNQEALFNYYDTLWHTDISDKLYKYILANHKGENYNYVDEAFLDSANLSDLETAFQKIATQITKATEVSTVCVSLDKLLRDGYLSKDTPKELKLDNKDLRESYVKISYNEATNQYSYNYLKDDDQKNINICKEYISKNPED